MAENECSQAVAYWKCFATSAHADLEQDAAKWGFLYLADLVHQQACASHNTILEGQTVCYNLRAIIWRPHAGKREATHKSTHINTQACSAENTTAREHTRRLASEQSIVAAKVGYGRCK